MPKLRRRRCVLALALALPILASACSSDKAKTTTTESAGAAPTTATGEPTTTSGSTATTTGGTTATTQAATTTSSAPAVKYDRGAFLRISYAGSINTLDPHTPTSAVNRAYQYAIYDRLFKLDFSDQVQPMLAKSFEFSPDGKTLTLRLRDDVVFHDGSPVNAEAVKLTLERGKTLTGSTVATSLSGITAIEVVDDFTVALTLDGAGPELPAVLSTNVGAIMNPKVFNDPSVDLNNAPPPAAGSGPYVVKHFEPSVIAEYERAPEYWDPSGALLAGYSITFVSQGAARLAGLQAGDFDVSQMTADTLEQAQQLADDGKIDMLKRLSTTRDLMFNIDDPTLSDINVRKAISLAIDRDAIGLALPCENVNTQPLADTHWAYNPDIKNVHDAEEAKKLIAAHGSVTFNLDYPAANPTWETIATVIQAQLANVGITVNLTPQEAAGVFPRLTSGESQVLLNSIVPGPDPVDVLDRFFVGGVKLARGTLEAEVRAAAAPGRDVSATQEKRAAIYKDVFKLIADNYVYVPLCKSPSAWAWTKPVVGFENIPSSRWGIPDFSTLGVTA